MKYHEKRLAICKGCEFYLKPTGQCLKCGCFMKIKTRIKSLPCPIDKYPKVRSNKEERELIEFVQSLGQRVTVEEQNRFWQIYNETFDTNRKSGCRSCLFSAIKELKKHYK